MSPLERENLSKAQEELADALNGFDECETSYKAASLRQTTALNRLNNAQKVFDECVAAIKKTSPHSSDWNRNNRKGLPASE